MPVAFEFYDGSRFGPCDAPATIVVRSQDAIRRIKAAPNELGFGRAYVAGDIDVDGDVLDALALREWAEEIRLSPRRDQKLLIAGLFEGAAYLPF